MPRSYNAEDLVQLPKLTVSAAIALGQALSAAAGAIEPLPAAIKKTLGRLRKTHSSLLTAAGERLATASGDDSPVVREADRDIDAAWSATMDWATGWSKLPGKANEANAASAKTLLSTVFSDGLKFTQLKVQLEWAESQTRIDLITQKNLEPIFAELGGTEFWNTIKAAHKVYGEVLGMTKPKAAEADVKQVGTALDEFHLSLRKYVVSVTASVDDEEEHTITRANALLLPLAVWETAPTQEKQAPTEPIKAEGDGSP
jgi:hypothetical protein